MAGDQRCQLSDLPAEMRAHCRNIPDPPREDRTLGRPFAAAFPGRCVDCDEPFSEGDRIRADGDGGYVCSGCGDEG